MKQQMSQHKVAVWLGDAPGKLADDPTLDALDALYRDGPAPQAVQAAQAQLKRRLAQERKMTITYDWTDTGLGRLYFAASPHGLVAVDFGISERKFVDQLRARHGAAIQRTPGGLPRFARQLADYVAGKRTAFDLPLDLSRVPPFQRQVLMAALAIPRGQVATYGEIARRIGHPRASRAVGQALGHNPIPLVIPCHRVVGSDGSLRGYGSGQGVKTKAELLRLEGARPAAS
jgi:methylated-DNA-[protein]-cysteine S-methyltransferase